MKLSHWVVLIAVPVLLIEGVLFTARLIDPPCPPGERFRIAATFEKSGGFSYFAPVPELEHFADTSEQKGSPMLICEDNRILGPAHAAHRDVVELGRGRFSHWGTDLLFSTSDNSDPNINGRSYLLIRPSE